MQAVAGATAQRHWHSGIGNLATAKHATTFHVARAVHAKDAVFRISQRPSRHSRGYDGGDIVMTNVHTHKSLCPVEKETLVAIHTRVTQTSISGKRAPGGEVGLTDSYIAINKKVGVFYV